MTVIILRLDAPVLESFAADCGMTYSYALLLSVLLASLLALSANGSVCSHHCWPSMEKNAVRGRLAPWGGPRSPDDDASGLEVSLGTSRVLVAGPPGVLDPFSRTVFSS